MRKLYLLLFINLISCGGGGGGSSEAPVPPPITTTPTIASACTSEGGAPTVSQQLQWPHYSSDQYASRYLDTDKLTETNFSNLTLTWRWTSPTENLLAANSDLEAFWNESTPIMINGVLFVSSQFNHIVAINAETGQAIWTFDPQSYQAGRPPNHGFVHRGVAYWEKDNDKRIFVGTLDSFLYSIDACTGEVDLNFNNGGKVNLLEGLGRAINNDHYGVNSPPLVCKDTVVVGSSVMDYPAQYLDATSMAPGDVRAYDAITGQLKWQFHVIPHEGEFGADTWKNTSYLEGAGVNVWSTFSCDEELGMVYLPLTTPTNDHFGGDRLGDNLFAESVVALDIETGDRKWHFQTVHHGLWDYDLPAAPNLVDVTTEAGTEKLLAQITKQAFLFVFNRETGQPKWPITETPVPQSTVTGEQVSLTQPIPSRPAPYDHQGVNENNIIDFTDSLKSKALDIISEYDYGELYLPPSDKGTLTVPSIGGGGSWSGASYHSGKNTLFVPSVTWPFVTRIERSGLQTTQNRDFVNGPEGLPLMKPPYGRVTAISMDTGDHLWVAPIGRGYEQNSQISSLSFDDYLGVPQRVFTMTTKNLLISGQQRLSAFNLDTGNRVGEVNIPDDVQGNIMAYELNNKLYLVIPIGGSGNISELVAYSLN